MIPAGIGALVPCPRGSQRRSHPAISKRAHQPDGFARRSLRKVRRTLEPARLKHPGATIVRVAMTTLQPHAARRATASWRHRRHFDAPSSRGLLAGPRTPDEAGRNPSRRRASALLALLTLATLPALLPTLARAQAPEPRSASSAPLHGLTSAELAVLAPDLDRGPVLYTRFRPDQREMPEIVFATRVNAPAAAIAEIIAQPERYPEFMSALDEIEVESRRGPQLAYRWRWRIALFTLTGRNAMTVMPPHPARGHRIEVRSTGGDMGLGRFSWRVHPDGPSRATLVLASRVDMRGANYLADQLASGGIAVQRSINVALASVMALGTKARAEAAHAAAGASAGAATPTEPELTRPPIDLERLGPLLVHGDLAFLELDGDALVRVSIAARMGTDLAHTRAVMEDPEQFGRSLVHGSTARVIERDDDGVLFEWGIPLPLVGIDGRMRLAAGRSSSEDISEGVIAVDGVSGSLRSGHWRFDTHVYASGEAAVIGWARFDPSEASRLVRRMLAGDVALSHGLAMATQVMIVRSLRLRALGRR